jgi:methyl-accepting chemotaxis protein
MAASPLHKLSRWITTPELMASVAAGLMAVVYGWGTLSLSPGGGLWFGGIAVIWVLMATVRGDWQEQRALGTLRGLGEGRLKPEPSRLRKALVEVFGFPDRAFWFNLQNWAGGAIGIALTYRLLAPMATTGTSIRIAMLGIALAPVSSLLNYVMVVFRVREAILRIAALGLSTEEVLQTLPPRRMQLRTRLMLFTAICVLTPTVMIADVVVQRTQSTLDELLEAPTREAQQEIYDQADSRGLGTVFALGGMVIALVVATGFVSGTALGSPMRLITEEATRVASGNLTGARLIPAEDELWAASAAFSAMQTQLATAISQLQRAGLQISTTTEQLLATSSKHEAGSSDQAAALAETSATTEELARSARQIADNAQTVAQMAEQTLAAAQSGRRSAEAFFTAMGRMREQNQSIADAVVRLNKRVQQIGKIVEFINDVADKADLLALNAELEGDKAGEVGRGFSLVAAEMRRLAESVMVSTREIGRLIEEIRDDTHAAVMATEAGVKATDRGSALSQQVSENLKSILDLAAQTSDSVRAISLATFQQQTGTDQLATAMADILRSTAAGKVATQQVAAANSDLSTLARDLKQVVERFTVN